MNLRLAVFLLSIAGGELNLMTAAALVVIGTLVRGDPATGPALLRGGVARPQPRWGESAEACTSLVISAR